MAIAVVTGSSGLIGSQSARHFAGLGYEIWGVDNDMRAQFFGEAASTTWMRDKLNDELSDFHHHDIDIRDRAAIDQLFRRGGNDISLVIHAAAQPSHDWAATDPHTDFAINATGTLVLLEATRTHTPEAVFIYTSTNKVYGDTPNRLPFAELNSRYELPEGHKYYNGINEEMSIDQNMHSLFGVSKASADLMVQEYGRYFTMNTGIFRGGCLTGSGHSGAQLHGFLAYLLECTVTGRPYTVFGYKGKQVRDNIHSSDLTAAFEAFSQDPKQGAVYNIGGGRQSNCSMVEAIGFCQELASRELNWTYNDTNRVGDHVWWISDLEAFKSDFPKWDVTYDVKTILYEMYGANKDRWLANVT